jgi:hypothetical protein
MKLYDKRNDFNIPIAKFLFICSNIPTTPVYGVYISQLIRHPRACGSYYDFFDRGLLLARKLLNRTKGSYWLSWSHHFESFTVATMTWLTPTEYMYHKWPWICSVCHISTSRSFRYSWLVTGLVTRATRRVSLLEQELPILPEHLNSSPIFIWVRSLVFCVVFCRSLNIILYFFFCHYVVCPSSIYEFWLPL